MCRTIHCLAWSHTLKILALRLGEICYVSSRAVTRDMRGAGSCRCVEGKAPEIKRKLHFYPKI